jgi:hypothetical protein
MKSGRLLAAAALACLVVALTGCGDRRSVARLQMRRDQLQSLADAAARGEARRSEYTRRSAGVFEEWWERDVERFHQRAAAVGDYLW